MVWLLYGSANRDHNVFTCPDGVDLERINAGDHSRFGSGPHICIGANIAIDAAHSALTHLLAQTKQIVPPESQQLSVLHSYVMLGLNSVTVRLT